MKTKIYFLGTGCMVPTKERNHISNALEFNGNIFLFDCGEGTQLQIKKMKLAPSKIKKIFISHWHGDHTLGLNGLIQTLSNTQGFDYLEIYGPVGSKKYIFHMLNSTCFKLRYKIKIIEINIKKKELKTIFENEEYKINCVKLNHSTTCIGYSFEKKSYKNLIKEKIEKLKITNIETFEKLKNGEDVGKYKSSDLTYIKKGVKICFVFDTRPCPEINLLVKNSNILICEATYLDTEKSKAVEYDHMSAKETATLAKKNKVEKLFITHFSQRYTDTKLLEEEAKKIFKNTTAAVDLMNYEIVY